MPEQSLEKSTYTNPISVRRNRPGLSNNRYDYTITQKIFKNQKPGMFVRDFDGANYYCTLFKTSVGEPIWARISGDILTPTGDYFIYLNFWSDSWKTVQSATQDYKEKKYRDKYNEITKQNKDAATNFFWQITGDELKRIVNHSWYNQSSFAFETADLALDEPTLIINSLFEINKKYEYMKYDSNGKSSSGAVSYPWMPANSDNAPQIGRRGATTTELNSATPNPDVTATSTSSTVTGTTSGTTTSTTSGTTTTKTTSSSNTAGGGSTTTNNSKTGIAKTNIVIKPDKSFYTGANDFSLPYMKQMINHFNAAENSRQRIERIHVFDMVPNSFEFSQLSSQWNEVARAGNYPLVDWSNYNLTKVSFKFLVVAKRLENNIFYSDATKNKVIKQTSEIVNDGLLSSIDEQLDNVRAMLGSPAPIRLYNMNNLLSTEYRYPYVNNTRNMEWVIADASITATRLTENASSIAAAEVSITLTEYPVVARDIVRLPPLIPDRPHKKICKSGDCPEPEKQYALFTSGYEFERDALETASG